MRAYVALRCCAGTDGPDHWWALLQTLGPALTENMHAILARARSMKLRHWVDDYTVEANHMVLYVRRSGAAVS